VPVLCRLATNLITYMRTEMYEEPAFAAIMVQLFEGACATQPTGVCTWPLHLGEPWTILLRLQVHSVYICTSLMARHMLPDTAVGRMAGRLAVGPLQDHPGLLQHLCAGTLWQGWLTYDACPMYGTERACSLHLMPRTAVCWLVKCGWHCCAQGMMLLAGSTTVYQVLPAAGEKKKQKLQVALVSLLY
jgi:hypothetical protein